MDLLFFGAFNNIQDKLLILGINIKNVEVSVNIIGNWINLYGDVNNTFLIKLVQNSNTLRVKLFFYAAKSSDFGGSFGYVVLVTGVVNKAA